MAWNGLADVTLNEATAAEVIARHVGGEGTPRPTLRRFPKVDLACDGHALGELFAEVLETAGYRVGRARSPEAAEAPWVVWDVPTLEGDWADRLAAVAQRRGVVALIALADRERVGLARRHGAIACLDLPCEPDDLVFVLDRLTAHRHRRSATRRDGRQPARPTARSAWAIRGTLTIIRALSRDPLDGRASFDDRRGTDARRPIRPCPLPS